MSSAQKTSICYGLVTRQNNIMITSETLIANAIIQAPKIVNDAEGKINAQIANNKAAMESYYKVTEQEATSYASLKNKLSFNTDDQFLNYVKVKTINGFNKKNLIIGESK